MQMRRALTFMFADPAWPSRLGLAFLCNLPASLLTMLGQTALRPFVPLPLQDAVSSPLWPMVIVGLARVPFSGYELRLLRQVIAGHDVPLPAWSDGGNLVRDGLRYWVVTSLWLLPGDIFFQIVGDVRQLPGALLPVALIMTLFSLVAIVALPAARARLATTGSVGAGLSVQQVLGFVRRNLGGYVLLAVVTLVGAAMIFYAGVLITRSLSSLALMPLIGAANPPILLCGWYLALVLAHLAGQVYASPRRG
jgi:hypothetical protein